MCHFEVTKCLYLFWKCGVPLHFCGVDVELRMQFTAINLVVHEL